MAKLNSQISTASDSFKRNEAANLEALKIAEDAALLAQMGGGEASRERHLSRGKLLPRDRVQNLLDIGSPFLEIGATAAHGMHNGDSPCASLIAGIGRVEGREVMIVCNDATVKGGTYYPMSVKKHLRAQEIAEQNNLPCVYLVDSGGANLPNQAEGFADREHFGRIFFNQANMSAKGIPQIAAVMGSCTAGGAYVPAMSDVSIIVKEQGTIFLAGPPLVKAATGEIVSAEELGGGDVHTRLSGVADYLAEDDNHALAIARRAVANLNRVKNPNIEMQAIEEPAYDPAEILGVVPGDLKTPYDIREVIARIVDGSRFDEFKVRYGPTLVCGFAHVMGMPVGIIANNGVLFSESAVKGAHFVELCSQRKIPLVFLQNITGFMVGQKYEQGGIGQGWRKTGNGRGHHKSSQNHHAGWRFLWCGQLRHGGAGHTPRVSCGLGRTPASPSWAANKPLAYLPLSNAMVSSVKGGNWSAEEEAAFKQPTLDMFEEQAHPLYASARLWDDGIIDPRKTRNVLALSLSAALNAPIEETKFGIFRM